MDGDYLDGKGTDVTGYDATARPDRSPLTVLLLLLVVAAVQLSHYYPLLPGVIATHFDVSGRVDGWSEKLTFIITYGSIEVVVVAVGLLLARFATRIPAGALNIPNRDYWLAPERRAETLQFVWTQVLWMEVATLAFLILVAEVLFRANLASEVPTLSHDFFIILGVFIAVVAWMSVRIVRRFRVSGSS